MSCSIVQDYTLEIFIIIPAPSAKCDTGMLCRHGGKEIYRSDPKSVLRTGDVQRGIMKQYHSSEEIKRL